MQPKSNKIGRPEVDPQEIMDRLKLALMWNLSLARACNRVGINRKTVYNLIKRHPWMKEEIQLYKNMFYTHGPDIINKAIQT